MCPIDSDHFSERQTHRLARSMLKTFNKHVEGQFMWNFRNEMEDKWSYINAYDKGWVNQSTSDQFEEEDEDLTLWQVIQ